MKLTDATPESRRGWRSIRRRHLTWVAVRALYWLAYAVVSLVGGGGEAPALDGAERSAGAWSAGLALSRTTGPPRERQRTDWPRWIPTTVVVPGRVWLMSGVCAWAPKKWWAEAGARAFLLDLPAIRELQLTTIGRSAGVAISSSGSSVWLWMRESDARDLAAHVEGSEELD